MSELNRQQHASQDETHRGIILGFSAYLTWGLFPAFFKLLAEATPLEIISHRIFWSSIFLLILVLLRRRVGEIVQVLVDRKILLTLCASTLLIATNWLTFLYAVQQGTVKSGLFHHPTTQCSAWFYFPSGAVEIIAEAQPPVCFFRGCLSDC